MNDSDNEKQVENENGNFKHKRNRRKINNKGKRFVPSIKRINRHKKRSRLWQICKIVEISDLSPQKR